MRTVTYQKLQIAEQLIRLGARTPTLASAMGLTVAQARKVYSHIIGHASTSGQSPFDAKYFLGRTTMTSSLLASLIEKARAKNSDAKEVEVFIEAYTGYLMICGNKAQISADRAWNMMAHLRSKTLKTVICQKCFGRIVVSHIHPRSVVTCPVCAEHKKISMG